MDDTTRPRRPNGQFEIGQPAPTVRRKRGVPNRIPGNVKNWLLEAAIKIGSDGQGAGGGAGFVESVGRQCPELLLAALIKLLPTPKPDEEATTAGPITNTINILPVASANYYLSPEQMARATGIRPPGPVLVAVRDDSDELPDTV